MPPNVGNAYMTSGRLLPAHLVGSSPESGASHPSQRQDAFAASGHLLPAHPGGCHTPYIANIQVTFGRIMSIYLVGASLGRAVVMPPSISKTHATSGRVIPLHLVGTSLRRDHTTPP